MTFVVQEPCLNCKYADCVDVCPVECFYEDANILYINPEECIDCTACEPVCPVQAIVPDDQAKDEWLERAKSFNYTDETRRSRKEDVTHGPNWDAKTAGES